MSYSGIPHVNKKDVVGLTDSVSKPAFVFDPLSIDVWKHIKRMGIASEMDIDRTFDISRKRTTAILNQLEAEGKLGPNEGFKPRKIFR